MSAVEVEGVRADPRWLARFWRYAERELHEGFHERPLTFCWGPRGTLRFTVRCFGVIGRPNGRDVVVSHQGRLGVRGTTLVRFS